MLWLQRCVCAIAGGPGGLETNENAELGHYCAILHTGAVSGEMFRHMQNSEIIRKMTEEFDEVR